MSRDKHRTPKPETPTDKDDQPVLPVVTRDELGEGWGEDGEQRDADWYRRERPPHHE